MIKKTQDEKIAESIIKGQSFDCIMSRADQKSLIKHIADALQKAREEERERCAVLASELPSINTYQQDIQWNIAQAIRLIKEEEDKA